MLLEDHVGDVIRKARLHSGVALEVAAQAAGLSPTELGVLEDSGQSSKPPAFRPLAGLLGLNPDRLEGLAGGWTPAPVDLGRWRELRMLTSSGAGLTVNCYLAWDEVTRDAALFDTGFDLAPLEALIRENDLQLRHVFITHGHADHVAVLAQVRERFPKARLHTGSKTAPVEQRNRPADCIQLGSLRITNRETPGHAEDGVTYVIGTWPEDAPHVAVVGDAIFAGSMGRAVGQADLARQKVREQILSLPPATLICPGHGPLTTLGEQRDHNPFF